MLTRRLSKKSLNKLVPFMVRQAHHERNKQLTVRPEPVEGLHQGFPNARYGISSARQGGVVLLITLIVLVAMTLAGIAMVRSMDTTNIIAGNLAFQQSATHAGDTGIETAIAYIENNNGPTLFVNGLANGYAATWLPVKTTTQSWDGYWSATLAAQSLTMAADATGNTVSYAIQRMCPLPDNPRTLAVVPGTACDASPSTIANTNSEDPDSPQLRAIGQVYYRITARIAGPRNTVSYVQSIAAL
jgi:type IV pilus assembly protein PilX